MSTKYLVCMNIHEILNSIENSFAYCSVLYFSINNYLNTTYAIFYISIYNLLINSIFRIAYYFNTAIR